MSEHMDTTPPSVFSSQLAVAGGYLVIDGRDADGDYGVEIASSLGTVASAWLGASDLVRLRDALNVEISRIPLVQLTATGGAS